MNIQDSLDKLKPKEARNILEGFLYAYLTPAFGSIPKREIDLLVFEMLEKIGYTKKETDIYNLVQQLRVTRSKARNLLYDNELRKLSLTELDSMVKEAVKNPIIQKQGDLFALEIENLLVADHLRYKLKKLNHASDGSFSPSLIKLTKTALVAVMADYWNKNSVKDLKLRKELGLTK